jgi:hypothetical protein
MTEPAAEGPLPQPVEQPVEQEPEGPSEAVLAVRAKYGDAPRQGSLRKLAPGQGLALIGIVCCAWTPFILWWAFGPAALVLGALAYRKGEKRAKWLVLAAVLCMIAGIIMNNLPDKFVSN